MSQETIIDVFVAEDSPEAKYLLEIEVIYKASAKKLSELIQYSASEKLVGFNRKALDEIVSQTFAETDYAKDEEVFGFSYKVLEI